LGVHGNRAAVFSAFGTGSFVLSAFMSPAFGARPSEKGTLYSTGAAAHGAEERQARCFEHSRAVVRVALLENLTYQDYGFRSKHFPNEVR
jgi:hypothetical protein